MKKSNAVLGGLVLVALVAGLAGCSETVSEGDDQAVSFDGVPIWVVGNMQNFVRGGEIVAIEQEKVNGKLVYVGKVIEQDGEKVDVLFSLKGEWVGNRRKMNL